mmetsp:Transcript_31520/g.39203  ORF Transcript_31520/g.39203 Transcript_31520/m.39203 type:complete len:93 (-) Transcript_31520:1188-1466(-)
MVDTENRDPNHATTLPDDAPIEAKVRAHIELLDALDRSYFGKDRVRKIRELLDASCAMLDTKPIDLVQNKKEKAELLYLRGRTLDFLPEYTK